MTPEEANERMRKMCIEASDIADEQGWDWTIKARIGKRPGWNFQVFTDVVRPRRTSKDQLPLIPAEGDA